MIITVLMMTVLLMTVVSRCVTFPSQAKSSEAISRRHSLCLPRFDVFSTITWYLKKTCFHTCLLPSPGGGNFQSQHFPFISSAGCALHREAVLSICCMYKASRPHETRRLMGSRHMCFILISSIMLLYKTPKEVNLHQHSIFLSGYFY